MIVLDTHVWIWWVDGGGRLPQDYQTEIAQNEPQGLGVSAISCWEVAVLVALGRLALSLDVRPWLQQALRRPGIRLLELSPEIAVESTQLPGPSTGILPTGSSLRPLAPTTVLS